ncbi:DUF3383 family protein [Raoultella sp. Lac2]|uniref:DUF3383 domain-containing protein n=1 Tax=unclassified Raoultella TaxID=2627600 RepID=UPI001355ADCF|nr:DUF3383 family protein [Raoultella sp. Lac2]MXF99224.1 DUF3383 family protein [Raoultella sp. Lac1]
MAISLSKIAQMLPGVLKATGTAIDLNGLFLTDSAYAPVGAVPSFASADEVKAYFGSASIEYTAATLYFAAYANKTQTPGKLFFSRFNTGEAAAFLRSGSHAVTTLAQLKLLTGTLVLTVDGTLKTSAVINLSGATSFDNAAALIETGIGASVDVVWDSVLKKFIITSATSGEESSITFANDGSLAVGLKLTEATGAVISQGAEPAVVEDIFTAILAKEQNWVTFSTTFAVTKDQANAFALWTNNQNHRFAYVPWDASGTAVVAGSTNPLVYDIINTYAYNDTSPVYGYPNHAANAMGFVAALNFNQANGRCSLNGRQVSGLLPMVSNDADYEAAKANGYNFYGKYAANAVETNQWTPGTITGDFAWLDAWAGQVWINAQLQAALVALFQQASNLPYATAGKARIESCMKPPIEQFRAWGGLTAGTNLDQSQLDQIRAITGVDVSDALMSDGYYIYIGPFTAAMRSQRTKPAVYFWYTDGGIIQGITVNSVEVQ